MSHVVVIGGFAPSLVLFRAPLLAEIVSRGHRVTALAADGTDSIRANLVELGVAFEELELERAGRDPLADLRSIVVMTRRLRALRPDVVFAYTIKPVIYGLLAARLAGIERRSAMITGLGYSFLGQDRLARRVLRFAIARGLRVSLSGVDQLFLQNHDDRDELGASGALPASVAPIIVRGSGVDPDQFSRVPLPPGPPVFLFVGRLLREKGIETFVELARRIRRRHPEVRFLAAGWVDPNPASIGQAELARWQEEAALEYLGEVSDVRPILAASHVLVLPSYREGTPRSVLEAMSMGRPVIVTDVPGCRDTIENGIHGWMTPLHDVDALVAAAQRFIDRPESIDEMGRRARTRIEQLYDARAIAKTMTNEMGL